MLGEHAPQRRLGEPAGDEQHARGAGSSRRRGRPASSLISADRRSARTCSACPCSAPPSAGRHSTTSSIWRASSKSLSVMPPALCVDSFTVTRAPRHREIGMVVRRLGEVADRVDQHQRRRPAVGLVDAADPAVLVDTSRAARFRRLGDLRLVVRRFFRRPSTAPSELTSTRVS